MTYIDMMPVRNEALNCIYGVLATISNYYKIEYDLMFVELWGFEFETKCSEGESSIGVRLSTGAHHNVSPVLLSEYIGLRLNKHIGMD